MLNYRWFFVFVLLCGLLIIAAGAHASTPSLYTKDGACRFYYFSPKNTHSWYIQTSDGLCDNGVVDGQGAVTVFNAFSQPIEEIYGFFNEGYWTGDMALSAPVLYQAVEEDSTQKVYFEIPNDTYYNFQLTGQMSAKKQKDGTYEPFKFCGPFRILLQTNESDLFTDNQKLIEIVDSLVKKTRDYCPAEETLYIYASKLERPNLEDIFFFAEVDLRAARITIKRNIPVHSTSLVPGMPSPSYIDERNSQNNHIDDSFFPDLNKDTGANSDKHLMQHAFNTQSRQNAWQPSRENEISTNLNKQSVVTAPKKTELKPLLSNSNTHPNDRNAGKVKTLEVNQSESSDRENEMKTTSPKVTPSEQIDKIPHLLLSSKIKRKPVQGTGVLYISNVAGDTGRSNKPNPLQIEGENLSVGWALVSGAFEYQSTSTSGKLRGKVTVESVVACQEKQCKDIR